MHRAAVAMLTLTLVPVGGWCAGAWHASSSTRESFTPSPAAYHSPAAPSSDPGGWSSLPVPLIDDREPDAEQDLYGNDVSDAVAKYRSDRSGTLYEEHSPHVEMAKPKPPTT